MKSLFIIASILFFSNASSQENGLIKLVFADKSNFHVTQLLGNKQPRVFYVLRETAKWNPQRFFLNEDLSSDSVRNRLKHDEHSPYNHTYIFRDTMLDRLFSAEEKNHLYQQTVVSKPAKLIDTFKIFKLIKSSREIKSGFFFSITEPVFSSDGEFAFLDMTTFQKGRENKKMTDIYFSTTLLIYQNTKGKGWKQIKKIDYLIL